jgi:hypothetical protein
MPRCATGSSAGMARSLLGQSGAVYQFRYTRLQDKVVANAQTANL